MARFSVCLLGILIPTGRQHSLSRHRLVVVRPLLSSLVSYPYPPCQAGYETISSGHRETKGNDRRRLRTNVFP